MNQIKNIQYPNTVASEAKIDDEYLNRAYLLKDYAIEEFFQICKIPHPSGHTEQIQNYLVKWGKSKGFKAWLDSSNCAIIDIPAKIGFEHFPKVVFQTHTDMVIAVKKDLENFDPLTCSIKPYYDKKNGCIHTKWKTSLGADDCWGVSVSLAIARLHLTDDCEFKHGPIRLIFTYDEETDLSGVRKLSKECIDSDYLINIDSVYVGQLLNSSAGAVSSKIWKNFSTIRSGEKTKFLSIEMYGLTGGHSGEDINKGRMSTVEFVSQYLSALRKNSIVYNIEHLYAGTSMNAIPSQLDLKIAVGYREIDKILPIATCMINDARNNYTDGKNLKTKITIEDGYPTEVFSISDTLKFEELIGRIPKGIRKMIDNTMPHSSSNLGVIQMDATNNGQCLMKLLYRSIDKNRLDKLNIRLKNLVKEMGMTYKIEGIFPAWSRKENNPLNNLFLESYRKVCGFEGKELDIHSGTECGYIAKKFPHLTISSIGCDIINEHTIKETLFTDSIPAFMASLLYVLQNFDKLNS